MTAVFEQVFLSWAETRQLVGSARILKSQWKPVNLKGKNVKCISTPRNVYKAQKRKIIQVTKAYYT